MTTEDVNEPTASRAPTGPITAKGGTYYRTTGVIMALVMFVFGVWSLRDGFIAWPKQTQRETAAGQKPSHNHLSILMNQVLGVVLPPASIALLAWRLYSSRGQVRLDEADTLHAPGHPPVPLDSISALDRSLWDRKGIAYVSYELPSGPSGQLKLDDFVYDRDAIDDMYDRIVKHLGAETSLLDGGAPAAPSSEQTDS
jgi:hypothetical protein